MKKKELNLFLKNKSKQELLEFLDKKKIDLLSARSVQKTTLKKKEKESIRSIKKTIARVLTYINLNYR